LGPASKFADKATTWHLATIATRQVANRVPQHNDGGLEIECFCLNLAWAWAKSLGASVVHLKRTCRFFPGPVFHGRPFEYILPGAELLAALASFTRPQLVESCCGCAPDQDTE